MLRNNDRLDLRAISVPLAQLYIENRVQRAICCLVSCWNYVFMRIRFLPRSPSLCHGLQLAICDQLLRMNYCAQARPSAPLPTSISFSSFLPGRSITATCLLRSHEM